MAARTIGALIAGLALAGCGSVADAPPEPEGVEMSVFRVPSRHGLAPSAISRALEPREAPTDEAEEATSVLMPPDVVALPGEALDDALDRALAEGPATGLQDRRAQDRRAQDRRAQDRRAQDRRAQDEETR